MVSPTLDFQRLMERRGIVSAVTFFQLELEEGQITLELETWIRIWHECAFGRLAPFVEAKMLEQAKTFADFLSLRREVVTSYCGGAHLGALAAEKAIDLAVTFDECMEINRWLSLPKDRVLYDMLVEKMIALAEAYKDWDFLFSRRGTSSLVRRHAFQEMTKTAERFHEWMQVYRWSPWWSRMRRTAFRCAMARAETLYQWAELLHLSRRWSRDRSRIVAVIRNLSATVHEWHTFLEYKAVRFPQLQTVAVQKMVSSATTFEDWEWVYEVARGRKDVDRANVLANLAQRASSFPQWRIVYDAAVDCVSQTQKDNALDRMAEYAKEFDEWKFIFEERRGEERGEQALIKMAEVAMSVEEWHKIFLGAILNPRLRKMALGRIESLVQEDSMRVRKLLPSAEMMAEDPKITDFVLSFLDSLHAPFEWWEAILYQTGSKSSYGRIALAKMRASLSKESAHLLID